MILHTLPHHIQSEIWYPINCANKYTVHNSTLTLCSHAIIQNTSFNIQPNNNTNTRHTASIEHWYSISTPQQLPSALMVECVRYYSIYYDTNHLWWLWLYYIICVSVSFAPFNPCFTQQNKPKNHKLIEYIQLNRIAHSILKYLHIKSSTQLKSLCYGFLYDDNQPYRCFDVLIPSFIIIIIVIICWEVHVLIGRAETCPFLEMIAWIVCVLAQRNWHTHIVVCFYSWYQYDVCLNLMLCCVVFLIIHHIKQVYYD